MRRRLASLTILFTALLAAPALAADPSAKEGDAVSVPVPEGLCASYETMPGTAKEGEDFTPASGLLGPGQETVAVATTEDDKPEVDEGFTVDFACNGETTSVAAAITDDDLPKVTVADGAALENTGAVVLTVGVTPVSREVKVTFAASDGTATDGADFRDASGTLMIPAGAKEAKLRIPFVDDQVDEDTETFTVKLGATSSAALGDDGQAKVTIGDDDARSISIGDASARESDGEQSIARIPVTLSAPTFRPVTVQFATVDGVARAPADYLSRLGSVTFAPGQTSQVVEVAVVSDDRREPTELFGVLLGKAEGAAIARAAGLVAVQDDDDATEASVGADTKPPAMKLTALRLSGRSITTRVTCPETETRCAGRLTFYSAADRKAKAKSLRRERRLGAASFTLKAGKAKTLKMTLSRTVLAAARRSGRLKVRAFALTRDGAGNVDTRRRSATLKLKRSSSSG